MFDVLKSCPPIVAEAKKAKFKPAYHFQILIFSGVFIVVSLLQSIPLIIYGIISATVAVMTNEIPQGDVTRVADYLNNNLVLPGLFSTCIITIIAILYCRFIEKRSLYSMGFSRKKWFMQYLIGFAVGLVMISASVLMAWAGKTLEFNGLVRQINVLLLLAFFAGFIVQGMAEEVMLRGYLMMSIAGRYSIILAVITNSVLFAVMHLSNKGVTVLAVINLVLFGIFASLYMLKTNSIWGVCAIHSIWNFAQGNIFGIKVSGIDTVVSVFSFIPTEDGSIINGGAFGLEGGLAVTAVLCISIAAVLLIKNRNEIQEHDNLVQELNT